MRFISSQRNLFKVFINLSRSPLSPPRIMGNDKDKLLNLSHLSSKP